MDVLLLIPALLIGALLAVQASVNLQLNKAVGNPFGASALQLAVAAGLLLIAAAATGHLTGLDLTGVEPWKLLGGIASPIYITSAILLLPRLGALASVGLFVTGQMLGSLLVDGLGLFGVPQRPLGAGTALGALAVVAGIALVIRGPLPRHPGWIALGLAAGGVLPIQGAINAALQAELRRPPAVGLISFTVATAAILLVLLATGQRRTQWAGLETMPWWGWLGGAAAATYVTATFLLIPLIGAATTVALTVTGQQVASAVIDQCGLFRLPKRALTAARAGGLTLLIVGSTMVRLV